MNPHVLPFFFENRGSGGSPTLHREGYGWCVGDAVMHRPGRQGRWTDGTGPHGLGCGALALTCRDGRRGGFLGSLLEDYLKLDMRKWLHLLQDLNLLPRVLGQDWTFVFLQRFIGSVTIVPYLRLSDYVRIISDPSRTHMAEYILGGERVTWPKLTMVANRVRIEHALRRAALSAAE